MQFKYILMAWMGIEPMFFDLQGRCLITFSPWDDSWSSGEGWVPRLDSPAARRSTAGAPACPSRPPVVPGPASPAAERGRGPAACGPAPGSPLCSGHWSGPPPWPESPGWCGLSGTGRRSEPSWPRCTAESAGSCGSPCCVGADVWDNTWDCCLLF